jgi:hypothetical protein
LPAPAHWIGSTTDQFCCCCAFVSPCQVKPIDTSRLDPTFLAYHAEAVAADIKEGLCRTNDTVFVPGDNKQMPSITYEVCKRSVWATWWHPCGTILLLACVLV